MQVYRETDKRSTNPSTPIVATGTSNSPAQALPAIIPAGRSAPPGPTVAAYAESSQMGMLSSASTSDEPTALGQGELPRPRSASEGGGALDRQRERQLVGSLTSSYKFKGGGLVKKVCTIVLYRSRSWPLELWLTFRPCLLP